MKRFSTLILSSVLLLPAVAFADDLVINDQSTVMTNGDKQRELTFNADSAGLLGMVARSDEDIFIEFIDQGNVLSRIDNDVEGQSGCEAGYFAVPRPGTYTVRLGVYGGDAEVTLRTAWLAAPEMETAPDPDGYASGATELTLGTEVSDSLDPYSGDEHDWYQITAVADGTITIEAWGEEDINLTTYSGPEQENYLDYADNDLDGDTGHEVLEIQATAGETYYLKVSPLGSAGGYRLVAN
jgi:Bacterial pre-peptidase C-terminal domain